MVVIEQSSLQAVSKIRLHRAGRCRRCKRLVILRNGRPERGQTRGHVLRTCFDIA
jgi:hypothetical protein